MLFIMLNKRLANSKSVYINWGHRVGYMDEKLKAAACCLQLLSFLQLHVHILLKHIIFQTNWLSKKSLKK